MQNEILKRALIKAAERELSELPSDEELSKMYQFTPAFESKMQKLLKKAKQKYVYIFHRPIRRMSIIAACVIIILTASFSVEAIRTPIIKFCVTVYEKFSSVIFGIDANDELTLPTTIEMLYAPSYIPDGYTLTDEMNTSHIRELTYSDMDDNEIAFQQYIIISTSIKIDTEGVVTEKIFINGIEGIFYTNKNVNTVMWHDNQYGYSITGKIDKSSLENMANSIKIKK